MEDEIFFIVVVVPSSRIGNPKGYGSTIPPHLPIPPPLPRPLFPPLPPPILGSSPLILCTSPSPCPAIVAHKQASKSCKQKIMQENN